MFTFFLISFLFHFCYHLLKRGCLTCIRRFCPFTLYQNKSPGPSIHKCCCYGYNLDKSVCLSCYELEQFSGPVVPKARTSVVFFFLFFSKKVNSLPSFKRHGVQNGKTECACSCIQIWTKCPTLGERKAD